MTYKDFLTIEINKIPTCQPIYLNRLAELLAYEFDMNIDDAKAATSVAMSRMVKEKDTDLRIFQKGIYYSTVVTAFGERGIDKNQLVIDKYLSNDNGYVTDYSALHKIGLTTQMPKEMCIASNNAHDCMRRNEKLGVVIRPAKTRITKDNKLYLQILDILNLMNKAPIDVERPYRLIFDYINRKGLVYDKLLYYADKYYNTRTVIALGHVVGEGSDA